jgi:hypothetical protein
MKKSLSIPFFMTGKYYFFGHQINPSASSPDKFGPESSISFFGVRGSRLGLIRD